MTTAAPHAAAPMHRSIFVGEAAGGIMMSESLPIGSLDATHVYGGGGSLGNVA